MPTEQQIEEVREALEMVGVERALSYTLADAIREGCAASGQAVGAWEDGEHNLCALQSALLAVKARRLA